MHGIFDELGADVPLDVDGCPHRPRRLTKDRKHPVSGVFHPLPTRTRDSGSQHLIVSYQCLGHSGPLHPTSRAPLDVGEEERQCPF